jgi:hypothetical protein
VTRAGQLKLGHPGLFFAMPKLIHNAKVNKAQQERQERYEEERRRRDHISLDSIATLTVERRTRSNNRGRGAHGFGRVREVDVAVAVEVIRSQLLLGLLTTR